MSRPLEQSIWISTAALVGLVALTVLTLSRLGGEVPALKPLGGSTNRLSTDELAFAGSGRWFQPEALALLVRQTNLPNPFFTTYFQPPPPPSTKPVELTYLGFVDSEGRPRRALVQVDNATRLFTAGVTVVADHVVTEIARRNLILTNRAGATNVLEFRIKKLLEIPAR